MRRIGFVFALAFFSSALLAAPPSDETTRDQPQTAWTLFRGNPLQTGVAQGKLPDKLVELWKFETKDGGIEGAPAVKDGVVYVGSLDEKLYALHLATGKEKWTYAGGPFKASPSLHDECIYIGDSDGVFHCIDAKGKQKWTFKTDGEITSSANFSGDLILFGSYDESLYCLTKDGNKKWTFKTQGPVNGSPAVADGKTFVAGCDSSIHVIDVAKGMEIDAVALTGQAAATAAVVNGQLYVGNMANDLQAVDLKMNKVAWTFTPKNAHPFFGSAAATEQLVVAGNRNKNVYAVDRRTGKQKWSFPTEGRIDSSPVIVGERIYIGSLDDHLYVIDLQGKQLQKIKLDSPVTGSPAVAEGRLLIGTQKGTLYCFGEKK